MVCELEYIIKIKVLSLNENFSKKRKKYIDILLLWVYTINIAREYLQRREIENMMNEKGIEEDIVKSAFSAMKNVDVSIRTAEEIAMIIGGIAIGITCVAEHLEVRKEILPRIVNGLQDLYIPKEKRMYWEE